MLRSLNVDASIKCWHDQNMKPLRKLLQRHLWHASSSRTTLYNTFIYDAYIHVCAYIPQPCSHAYKCKPSEEVVCRGTRQPPGIGSAANQHQQVEEVGGWTPSSWAGPVQDAMTPVRYYLRIRAPLACDALQPVGVSIASEA
jgi:hypothetical protein